METIDTIVATVQMKLPLPEEKFPADGEFWLTAYLYGSLDSYSAAKQSLVSLEWFNLELTEDFAGFVYAKKKLRNESRQISEAIRGILQVCEESGLELSLIDADTSFEPSVSTFHNLFKPLPRPQN